MRVEHAKLVVWAALIAGSAAIASCKQGRSAPGEVSRKWRPPHLESYMGVPAAETQAAIGRRLAADPPAPLTDDEWEHVNNLYGTFGQNLLWLDDKGVHQPRVVALLTALANAALTRELKARGETLAIVISDRSPR